MASPDYSITPQAYAKVVFHALKYPYAQVNGILLGKKDGNSVTISDSVALFHSATLAPMLEVAMMQIDEHAQRSKLEIIGYYVAKENNAIRHPDGVDAKIATKIHSTCAHACLLMVDPSLLNPIEKKIALKILFKRGDDWRSVGESSLQLTDSSKIFDNLSAAISKRTYLSLYDFDNHLEDNTKDWFNSTLEL